MTTHTDRVVSRLRRRLESAELDLLRELVAQQAARIEALEAELARVTERFHTAVDTAEYWRVSFMGLEDRMAEELPGARIGITQAGELVLLPVAPASH